MLITAFLNVNEMKSFNIDFISIAAIIMVALVPFSYFDILGLRIIGLSTLLFFMVFAIKRTVYIDANLLLFLGPFLLMFFLTLLSGSNDFLTLIIFSTYLLFFNVVKHNNLKGIFVKSCHVYIISAVLFALGVIIQRFLFEYFGYEFGKIDHYGGGRIGFGFLWLDYSFLSLYLLTAAPLVYYFLKNISIRLICSLVLLFGSIVTTARTGVAALIMTALFFITLEFFKTLFKSRANKKSLYTLFLLMVSSLVIVYLYLEFSTREISLGGSGRVEGYSRAIDAFLDNIYFGVLFNVDYYKANYGVIPHNLFLYILSHGGIWFSALFLVWIGYVLFVSVFQIRILRYSIIMSFAGTMFIPSFFSAYFLAYLISIAMLEKKLYCKGLA